MRVPLLLLVLLWGVGGLLREPAWPEDEQASEIVRYPYRLEDSTVIGEPVWHQPRPKESLLDLARDHGLGYNELELLYPRLDPWILPDKRLAVPTFWVLPPTEHEQLVINVPELRLYFFESTKGTVQTYPLGIGVEGWETPLGTFRITEKRPNPSWYIPASLQEEYGMTVMPPGPENPLGEYFMKFSAGSYGIHGTHMPWGVGRLVSHGCIRCYPEHIRLLFPQVAIGTRLEVLYEPVKFGRKEDQIFTEIHPDVYDKISDFESYAMDRLRQQGLMDQVDIERFEIAVRLRNGVPTNITRVGPPGELVQRPSSSFRSSASASSRDPSGLSGEAFTLQAASLRSRENARRLVEILQGKGYPSRLEVADIGDGGEWYRVLVGSFHSREEAEAFADRFLRREQLEGMVVQKEP